jgi:hypothetical protein
VADCFLVKTSDILQPDPKQGSFSADFWGHGVRRSYLEDVQDGMAAHAGRGRGRGRGAHFDKDRQEGHGGRFGDEQWGRSPGWWNPASPPFNFLIPMVSFPGSHCTPSLDQGRCISQVNTRGRGRGRGFSNLSRGQDPCSSGTET